MVVYTAAGWQIVDKKVAHGPARLFVWTDVTHRRSDPHVQNVRGSYPVLSKLGRRLNALYETATNKPLVNAETWMLRLRPKTVADKWVRPMCIDPLTHPVLEPKPFRSSFNESNSANRQNTRPSAELFGDKTCLLVLHSDTFQVHHFYHPDGNVKMGSKQLQDLMSLI